MVLTWQLYGAKPDDDASAGGEMAKHTTRLLFDIIAGKTQHQHIIYEAELKIKESTKSLHTENL